MRNEEALDELNVIYERLSHPENCEQGIYSFRDGDYLEALDMAIKALEQQPSEDCISRKATIDALWKALYEYENKTEKQFIDSEELDVADWFQHRVFVQNMSDIDRQTILNMPSVTPQPRIGHWEYVQYDSNLNIGNWHCSECRGICTEMHSIEDAYNYCPNCGAKMEVSE